MNQRHDLSDSVIKTPYVFTIIVVIISGLSGFFGTTYSNQLQMKDLQKNMELFMAGATKDIQSLRKDMDLVINKQDILNNKVEEHTGTLRSIADFIKPEDVEIKRR